MQILKPLLVASAASFGVLVLSLFVEPLPDTAGPAPVGDGPAAEAPPLVTAEFRACQIVDEQALDGAADDT